VAGFAVAGIEMVVAVGEIERQQLRQLWLACAVVYEGV
jgi:hypothetical protein